MIRLNFNQISKLMLYLSGNQAVWLVDPRLGRRLNGHLVDVRLLRQISLMQSTISLALRRIVDQRFLVTTLIVRCGFVLGTGGFIWCLGLVEGCAEAVVWLGWVVNVDSSRASSR